MAEDQSVGEVRRNEFEGVGSAVHFDGTFGQFDGRLSGGDFLFAIGGFVCGGFGHERG